MPMSRTVQHHATNTRTPHFTGSVFSIRQHPDICLSPITRVFVQYDPLARASVGSRLGSINIVSDRKTSSPRRDPHHRGGESSAPARLHQQSAYNNQHRNPSAVRAHESVSFPDRKPVLHNGEVVLQKQSEIQSRTAPRGEIARPLRGVRQDKGVCSNALAASYQPGALAKVPSPPAVNTKMLRSQKRPSARVKLVHTTLWLHPLIRAEFERIAKQDGLSLSQVGATACDEWVRYNIRKQQAGLLRTELRLIIREELRAFGNRIVFFLMRIAFACEQTRILVTNILDRILKNNGGEQKAFISLVDQSSKMAKRNIIRHTPELKSLMEEWEASFTTPNKKDAQRGE